MRHEEICEALPLNNGGNGDAGEKAGHGLFCYRLSQVRQPIFCGGHQDPDRKFRNRDPGFATPKTAAGQEIYPKGTFTITAKIFS
jgi:hypothetical protein